MSVEELAKKIGKSRATLYRYENDETADIPANVFPRLSKTFAVHPAYFLGWTDDDGIYEDPQVSATDNTFSVSSYTVDECVASITLYTKSKDANQVILRNKDNTLLAFDLTDEEFAAINVLLASLKK